MNLRVVRLLVIACVVCFSALPAGAAPESGRISGVVLDANGTPQMGATVLISSERLLGVSQVKLLTNEHGTFSSAVLPSGLYSVTVTLAGFLPTVENHLEVSQVHGTMVQVILGSVFSSLDQLRSRSSTQGASDDWVWVLRSSAANRSVLRWDDSNVALGSPEVIPDGEDSTRALMELSSGSDRPGSISNSPVAPATSFAYDVSNGQQSRLLVAGQFSYLNQASATGLAAEWLPSGDTRSGPVTTVVVRQSQFGPGGPVFRGVRLSHDEELALGERVNLRYGAEYVLAGFGRSASALRPRGEVAMEISPTWQASVMLATEPWEDALGDSTDALRSTLNSFDAFPALMVRHGSPVFENGFHEEAAVKHSVGDSAQVTAAVFHDRSTHTAVLGLGNTFSSDFISGFFGDAFAYDGGATESTGARAVYSQHMSKSLTTTVIYDYSGVLAVDDGSPVTMHLRDRLDTQARESVTTKVSARLPGTNTRLSVGYKWLDGQAVSQQDPYGESMYGISPYLSMGIRQPLPNILAGRLEVQADVGNLLQQGCIPLSQDGRQMVLIPAYRYFRGGLTLQF